MDFAETIKTGMKLIMQGCAMNGNWNDCEECPFTTLCSSIYADDKHPFSTPDSWEEEGLWLEN